MLQALHSKLLNVIGIFCDPDKVFLFYQSRSQNNTVFFCETYGNVNTWFASYLTEGKIFRCNFKHVLKYLFELGHSWMSASQGQILCFFFCYTQMTSLPIQIQLSYEVTSIIIQFNHLKTVMLNYLLIWFIVNKII
jgi:hypothetical protein